MAGLLRFEINGVSFLMTHDRRDVPRNLEGVQAVNCGHTHRYSEDWIDGRLWLNPGSCGRVRFGGEVTHSEHVKAPNKQILLSVQAIRRAIDRDRKITFRFCFYSVFRIAMMRKRMMLSPSMEKSRPL